MLMKEKKARVYDHMASTSQEPRRGPGMVLANLKVHLGSQKLAEDIKTLTLTTERFRFLMQPYRCQETYLKDPGCAFKSQSATLEG